MLQNLVVVPAQAVDAQDVQHVAGPQAAEHAAVGGAVEVPAALPVLVEIGRGNLFFSQRGQLAGFVLILGGYADIAVVHKNTS